MKRPAGRTLLAGLALAAALWAATALSACGHSGKPAAPAAAASSDFVGIYADDVFYGDAAYKRDALARQAQAGIGLIRQPFAWADFEKSPAPFDEFVAAAAQHGIRVLPTLLGPEPDAPQSGPGIAPPRDPAAFARYATALVQRYGPHGTLWSSRPDLRRLPITSWQIWNEPNIPAFWSTGPDAAAYERLLATTAAAIRKADRGAEIVTAGLPTSHLGIPAARFLEGIYTAGGKGSFATVAIHAYAHTPAEVLGRVEEARRVIARNGDDAKLWVTEVGWGTGGKPGMLTVSKDQQAQNLAQTVGELSARRGALGLRGVVVFQWHDPKPFPGRRPIWPYFAGLIADDGSPKPSLAAFEKAAAQAN
jgi:hypothetical protein